MRLLRSCKFVLSTRALAKVCQALRRTRYFGNSRLCALSWPPCTPANASGSSGLQTLAQQADGARIHNLAPGRLRADEVKQIALNHPGSGRPAKTARQQQRHGRLLSVRRSQRLTIRMRRINAQSSCFLLRANWQRSDPFAGEHEERITDGRSDHRRARFTDSRGIFL